MSNEWTHIDKGLPPCDGEAIFVGINLRGYCSCFTSFYEEGAICERGLNPIMTNLVQWKRLEMPEQEK